MNSFIQFTACTGYSKILEITLDANAHLFKKIIIVTKEDDIDTINLCKRFENVKTLFHNFRLPEDFKMPLNSYDLKRLEEGTLHPSRYIPPVNHFNRGGALQIAQEYIYSNFPNDFYLHLDADIVLPTNFTEVISTHQLKSDVLYGIRERRDYASMNDFNLRENYKVYRNSRGFFGFFQLYHRKDVLYDHWVHTGQSDGWFRDKFLKMSNKSRCINGSKFFDENDNLRLETLPIIVHHLGAPRADLHGIQFEF